MSEWRRSTAAHRRRAPVRRAGAREEAAGHGAPVRRRADRAGPVAGRSADWTRRRAPRRRGAHRQHGRVPHVHAQPARAAEDRERIEEAVADAARRNPTCGTRIETRSARGALDEAPVRDDVLDWVLRWQQFTGPVMAKGFEDTALYCHNALLAANDVGSDPVRPFLAAAELHARWRAARPVAPLAQRHGDARHEARRGHARPHRRAVRAARRVAAPGCAAGPRWRRVEGGDRRER
jgi:hypothetical protein